MNYHEAVAHILTRAADHLDQDRDHRLTISQAMDKALVGVRDATPIVADAISALETAVGYRGQGLDQIPRHAAILAARAEAARYQRYGSS